MRSLYESRGSRNGLERARVKFPGLLTITSQSAAKGLTDKQLLKIIRAHLNACVMQNELLKPTEKKTPQRGPLSLLFSNFGQNDRDQELERRAHHLVRYPDDYNIHVRGERIELWVKGSINTFITEKLELKLKRGKSAVARPNDWIFLGFSFHGGKETKPRISPQAQGRFKKQVCKLTRRTKGGSLERKIDELAQYLKAWIGYFGFCEAPGVLQDPDSWMRRRLRCCVWKHWRRRTKRFVELLKRVFSKKKAACTVDSSHFPRHPSWTTALRVAFPNGAFDSMGFPSMKSWHDSIFSRTAVYGSISTSDSLFIPFMKDNSLGYGLFHK